MHHLQGLTWKMYLLCMGSQLERIQNRAIIFITRDYSRDSSVSEMKQELNSNFSITESTAQINCLLQSCLHPDCPSVAKYALIEQENHLEECHLRILYHLFAAMTFTKSVSFPIPLQGRCREKGPVRGSMQTITPYLNNDIGVSFDIRT